MPLHLLLFYYISLGVNILAFFLMVVLLLVSSEKRFRDTTERKLFNALVLCSMIGALFEIIAYSVIILRMAFGPASWYATVRDIGIICAVVVLYHFVFQWMVYVDYRLYHSRDQLFRRYRVLYLPVLVFVAGRILAEYSGSIFELPVVEIFQTDLLLYIDNIFGFIFVAISAVIAFQYKNQTGHKTLFSILPCVIPVLIGYIGNWFTGYGLVAVGDAVGVFALYIVMVRQQHYFDSSGFYSKDYLKKLIDNKSPELELIRGAVVFETGEETGTVGKILREEMAADDLIIYYDPVGFILFSRTGKTGGLEFIADIVESAAKEDFSGISLTTKCITRKKDEDTGSFVKRIVKTR